MVVVNENHALPPLLPIIQGGGHHDSDSASAPLPNINTTVPQNANINTNTNTTTFLSPKSNNNNLSVRVSGGSNMSDISNKLWNVLGSEFLDNEKGFVDFETALPENELLYVGLYFSSIQH